MFTTAVIGLGLVYWANFGVPPQLSGVPKQSGAIYPDRAKNPLLLRDDTFEKQMVGQRQTTVRLPFGPPNAFQRTIEDPQMLLSNPDYGRAYQRNIRNVEIRTVDWRVDPKFNSPINNYSSLHMPENDLSMISKWSEGRKQNPPPK